MPVALAAMGGGLLAVDQVGAVDECVSLSPVVMLAEARGAPSSISPRTSNGLDWPNLAAAAPVEVPVMGLGLFGALEADVDAGPEVDGVALACAEALGLLGSGRWCGFDVEARRFALDPSTPREASPAPAPGSDLPTFTWDGCFLSCLAPVFAGDEPGLGRDRADD